MISRIQNVSVRSRGYTLNCSVIILRLAENGTKYCVEFLFLRFIVFVYTVAVPHNFLLHLTLNHTMAKLLRQQLVLRFSAELAL